MANVNHTPSRTAPHKVAWMVVGVVLSTSFIGACSRVPDAVNPAEWYRGTVDFFAGEDKDANAAKDGKDSGLVADRGKAPPGSDQPFPNLASVDAQARARDNAGGGLSADTQRPKYAPSVQRQAAATSTLRERPRPAPVAAMSQPKTQPAPPATPKPAVAPAPMVAPAPAKMAKPAPSPTFTPPVMTADQKATQDRLARQLAEIRSRAADGRSAPMTVASTSAGGDSLETLVISSNGIVSGGPEDAATSIQASPTATPAFGAGVKVATILFSNGSSKLKAADTRILGTVVRLQRKQGGHIRVVGHASSRTRNLEAVRHKMANFKISVARADQVAAALVRLGVSNKNIEIAAVSDAEPAYYEFMPSGEAGNRRTEVYLTR
ncbi:MAG: OmpA family protein [Alphaproteobacteria bacterium]|jgi:outer membrane protein OmpA-like peptidoglycan-associated protein|nr:OmpA family protein [Alphaproteobacteria bacterium]